MTATNPILTFDDVLRRYASGERDFTELDLDTPPCRELNGVCLDGADFSRSFIVASFQNARLRGAKFVNANVKTCDFRNADLRDADFSGAALCGTEFSGARLDGAHFGGAYYHSHEYQEGDIPD